MTTLTLEDIRAELKHISYSDGWTFTAWQHRFEGVWLSIIANVRDAGQEQSMVTLRVNSPLPPMPDVAALHQWLAWRLGIIELHELREWLKRDGVPLFDPHAEGVNDPPPAEVT